jgi:hypothetical protein
MTSFRAGEFFIQAGQTTQDTFWSVMLLRGERGIRTSYYRYRRCELGCWMKTVFALSKFIGSGMVGL